VDQSVAAKVLYRGIERSSDGMSDPLVTLYGYHHVETILYQRDKERLAWLNQYAPGWSLHAVSFWNRPENPKIIRQNTRRPLVLVEVSIGFQQAKQAIHYKLVWPPLLQSVLD